VSICADYGSLPWSGIGDVHIPVNARRAGADGFGDLIGSELAQVVESLRFSFLLGSETSTSPADRAP
jgi:hypothetical protein